MFQDIKFSKQFTNSNETSYLFDRYTSSLLPNKTDSFLLTCRKWSLETFCHNKMLLREGALFLRHVPFTMNLYIFESLKLHVEIFNVNIYHQRGEQNFNITYFDFVC